VPLADGPIVVWHFRGALLALPLSAVDEIATLDEEGRARARDGALDVQPPPGLGMHDGARWGVVVRRKAAGAAGLALAADRVEGVVPGAREVAVGAQWLEGLDLRHLAKLLRLDDGRLVALLDLESLGAEP
jgi:hypothetical protein